MRVLTKAALYLFRAALVATVGPTAVGLSRPEDRKQLALEDEAANATEETQAG